MTNEEHLTEVIITLFSIHSNSASVLQLVLRPGAFRYISVSGSEGLHNNKRVFGKLIQKRGVITTSKSLQRYTNTYKSSWQVMKAQDVFNNIF